MVLEQIRRWVRVAWVCRVSVMSCLAGAILFIGVTQARDLLLDFPSSKPAGDDGWSPYGSLVMAFYAARFGLLLLVFWAIPVHAIARLSLNRSEWLRSPYGSACDAADMVKARAEFE